MSKMTFDCGRESYQVWVNNGEWQHVVTTRIAGETRTFVNGEEVPPMIVALDGSVYSREEVNAMNEADSIEKWTRAAAKDEAVNVRKVTL